MQRAPLALQQFLPVEQHRHGPDASGAERVAGVARGGDGLSLLHALARLHNDPNGPCVMIHGWRDGSGRL